MGLKDRFQQFLEMIYRKVSSRGERMINLKELHQFLIDNPQITSEQLAQKYGMKPLSMGVYTSSAGFIMYPSRGEPKMYMPNPCNRPSEVTLELRPEWHEDKKIDELIHAGYNNASICIHLNIKATQVNRRRDVIETERQHEYNNCDKKYAECPIPEQVESVEKLSEVPVPQPTEIKLTAEVVNKFMTDMSHCKSCRQNLAYEVKFNAESDFEKFYRPENTPDGFMRMVIDVPVVSYRQWLNIHIDDIPKSGNVEDDEWLTQMYFKRDTEAILARFRWNHLEKAYRLKKGLLAKRSS